PAKMPKPETPEARSRRRRATDRGEPPRRRGDFRRNQFTFSGLSLVLAFLLTLGLQVLFVRGSRPKQVSYDEFLKELSAGHVAEVELRPADIVAKLKGPAKEPPHILMTGRLPGIDESPLLQQMQQEGVSFSGKVETATWW